MREIKSKMDPEYRGEEQEPSASAKTDDELLQVVLNNVWGMNLIKYYLILFLKCVFKLL